MKIAPQITILFLLSAVVTPCVMSLHRQSAIAQSLPTVTVLSTGDGDTIRVNQGGKTTSIRLGCIDAPERRQPGGSESAQRLRQLLPRGQSVQLRQIDRDRYGRIVGELFLNGQSLNLQLVQEGQAVVYRQYLNGCRATQNQYLQAEQQAKAARIGFWAQPNPVMPSEWRSQRRR